MRTRKYLLILTLTISLVLLVAGALLWSLRSDASPIVLTNGASLELLGVTQGSNSFIRGSAIEKLLGDLIPAGGFRLGAIELDRAETLQPLTWRDPSLTVWVLLSSTTPKPFDSSYWWRTRVLVSNENGREFENPPATPYSTSSNQVLFAVHLHAIPRDGDTLQLRLGLPHPNRGEPEWVHFDLPNPLPGAASRWTASPLPQTNVLPEVSVSLLNVDFKPTQLSIGFSSKGWSVPECTITDEEGNSFPVYSWGGPDDLNIQTVAFEYSLERAKTWKATLKILSADYFAPPLSLHELDFPDNERRSLRIGASGPEVRLTNQASEVFIARFDGNEISIRSQFGTKRPYWMVLRTERGTSEELLVSTRSTLRRLRPNRALEQVWQTKNTATNLTLSLACPEVLSTEFYFRPE